MVILYIRLTHFLRFFRAGFKTVRARTIMAKAFKTDMTESGTVGATYTINMAPPPGDSTVLFLPEALVAVVIIIVTSIALIEVLALRKQKNNKLIPKQKHQR